MYLINFFEHIKLVEPPELDSFGILTIPNLIYIKIHTEG